MLCGGWIKDVTKQQPVRQLLLPTCCSTFSQSQPHKARYTSFYRCLYINIISTIKYNEVTPPKILCLFIAIEKKKTKQICVF